MLVKFMDRLCALLAIIGVVLIVGGFLYVAFVMTFWLFQLPPPPRVLWAGMMLIMSSGLLYVLTHVLSGDFRL